MPTQTLIPLARSEQGSLPDRSEVADNVLAEFVRASQPWSAERVALPQRVRRALWSLLPVQLVWVIWLSAVATGTSSCRGSVCQVATLDGRALVLMVGTTVSLLGLTVLAVRTRGFASASYTETVGLGLAGGVGSLTVMGIVALLFALAVVGAALVLFFGTLTFEP